jgi:hypothetical protein
MKKPSINLLFALYNTLGDIVGFGVIIKGWDLCWLNFHTSFLMLRFLGLQAELEVVMHNHYDLHSE